MEKEIYKKVSKNIENFVSQYIDERDNVNLFEIQDRIIEKYINEICDETKSKIKSCTEKETEAYRKLMGIDNNGDIRTYKQVCQDLNKTNIRPLILNANRKMMAAIYKEIILEDKINLIKKNYEYQQSKGILLPENIDIDIFSSMIYYDYELLKEIGINSIKDITDYTIPELLKIIKRVNIKNNIDKKTIAIELINAIHILGFVFKNEANYEDQQRHFEKIRYLIKYPAKTYYNDEDINIKKELYSRKYLIEHLNKLLNQKKQLSIESKDIEQEIDLTKEKIIKVESKIRIRNIKHR